MEAGTSPPLGQGYPGTAMAGAALATIFFPLFALIAALLMTGGQPNPHKRAQLRMWAWVSAAWIFVWILVVVALVAAASHTSGTGPEFGTLQVVTTSP
jgi:hypothetical protein